MHYMGRGSGKPLLLIHGLGDSGRVWTPILDGLAAEREVIVVDLPGSGEMPPLPGEVSIRTLADAVTEFVQTQGLVGVDAVGSSMGRVWCWNWRGGILGAVVSLDPGSFWQGWQRGFFYALIKLSVKLIRLLQPIMPLFTGNAAGRTLLFPQFSAHPWTLSPAVTLREMRIFAASPSTDELLRKLAFGEAQEGAPRGALKRPLVMGWGIVTASVFPVRRGWRRNFSPTRNCTGSRTAGTSRSRLPRPKRFA